MADRKDVGTVNHVETANSMESDDAAFLRGFSENQRKALMWKIDIRLVPMLAFLYLMAYLDRANIGNAKIEGLETDLHLSGTQYNIALSIFFIPYILLVPYIRYQRIFGYICARQFDKPSTYLGILITTWGIVMTLTGLVKNFGQLVAVRFILGIFEAGFFPGAVFLISQWYLPNETQVRVALFYTSSALAGAFSGLLAFAIVKLDGVAGMAGWRWIFILEGIASALSGVSAFFFLVDSPALSKRWLTDDEIRYLELRKLMQPGNSRLLRESENARKWQITKSVLLDWQLYLQAFVYWSNSAPNYGMKFTMPQIIKNMGYTSSNAQLMTLPPYVVGAISAYVSALFSDRFKWRMPFIVGAQLLVLIAFAILFSKADKIADNIGVCYFALILACIGFYPINPDGNAWTVENLAGPMKRPQGVAYMICIGNIGGIIGSYIYIEKEAPKYPTGFGVSFGFATLGIVSCLLLEFLYWNINHRGDLISESDARAKYSDAHLEQMGDRSPLFRYAL